MRYITILFSLLIFFNVNATIYYVSATGNDSNPGTQALPFKSLEKLTSILKPGDNAWVRGGVDYRTTKAAGTWEHVIWQNLKGTAALPIRIEAEPGFPRPVLNLDNVVNTGGSGSSPVGILIRNCTYLIVKGIRITGFDFDMSGPMVTGMLLYLSSNIRIENVEIDHIGGMGLEFGDEVHYTDVINCDIHDGQDAQLQQANGISITGGVNVTNTLIDGCRIWFFSDDGVDLFGTDGKVTIKNTWAFWNGFNASMQNLTLANGFKLGPTKDYFGGSPTAPNTITRILHNNISAENTSTGYNQNGGWTGYQFYNNISYKHAEHGWLFIDDKVPTVHQFKNNISFLDVRGFVGPNNVNTTGTNNTWNNLAATTSDFGSLNTGDLMKPRKADGSLPDITAFKLSATSKMLNKGVNVGLPYTGTAPDLGPFESGTVTPPQNLPPITDAGVDITIQLPTNSANLTGIATDPDGIIMSYQWIKLSGGAATISNPTNVLTSVSGLVAGTYQFQLTVTDNNAATGKDQVTVTVKAALPPPPIYDTTWAKLIWYDNGTVLKRLVVTYFVKWPDGFYYDRNNVKRDIWFYTKPDGTKWSISGVKL